MTTINQYISDLRSIIKESGRAENVYTDQFLYSLLNGARVSLFEQESNKLSFISEWDWQQFPINLIKTKSHLIGCVPVGCDVLRSEFKLPRTIASNNKNLLKLTTYDYTPIAIESEQGRRNSVYDDIKSNNTIASIINDYVVIWNNPNLKHILASGVWEDVMGWAVIPGCDVDGNATTGTCFDIINSEFKISEKLKLATYKMVLDKLFPTLNKATDITNDSNSEIRA